MTTSNPRDWKKRFRVPSVGYGLPASACPARILTTTNQSGVFQVYVLDMPTMTLNQVTHKPTGVIRGYLAHDGQFVYYQHDQQGNELGHLVRVPVGDEVIEDLMPDLPTCSLAGVADSARRIGFVTAGTNGFELYVIDKLDTGELSAPRRLWQSRALTHGLTMSPDGALLFLLATERSGSTAKSLLALDSQTGRVVGELYDEGASIESQMMDGVARPSRVAGDARVLTATTRSGFTRPVIWNPITGDRQDLALESLDGDVQICDWSADGERLLLCLFSHAQTQLYLYQLTTRELDPIPHMPGTYGAFWGSPLGAARFTDDGAILVTVSSAEQAPSLVLMNPTDGQITRRLLSSDDAPPSQPWRSVTFPSTNGVPIQAWVAVPDGAGPFPTVIEMHGGPTSAQLNDYDPSAQAWLDHGYAWLSVNYRGSTTFGQAFQEAILGQLGSVEVEDVIAARQWLVDSGIAAPEQVFLTGASYGGYLTLQTIGRTPDLWAGGMALVAIADWFLMYEDQAELLRGYQVALFGGRPDQKHDAYAAGSPITYAEQIRAPLLIIQGRNDTRCPERQMREYIDKLETLGKAIQVYWFDAGHGSLDNEERIKQQEMMLVFANRVLAGQG